MRTRNTCRAPERQLSSPPRKTTRLTPAAPALTGEQIITAIAAGREWWRFGAGDVVA